MRAVETGSSVGSSYVDALAYAVSSCVTEPSSASRGASGYRAASWRSDLSVGGLTADERDRDVPHRRIRFGAMPMALTGLDVDDIADIDLALFTLCRHHP